MKTTVFSYRFAKEIIEHRNWRLAWNEILGVIDRAPLFLYSGKSAKNRDLDTVQQVTNAYFDRRFGIDLGWDYHPLATNIPESNLRADFRKRFGQLGIQVEVQFGNMARWYTDIFKFQAAYSQGLIDLALSLVPMASLARRIDSNVVQFERAKRELPSAELSITLPILLVGIEPDDQTPSLDLRRCRFDSVKEITGKGKTENRWRIVNGYLAGTALEDIGPESPTGPMPESVDDGEDVQPEDSKE
jgi:hypothetical protein